MNYKNPDFYRRSENFFPKKDNSAILLQALSKEYEEDTSKNFGDNEEISEEKVINEQNYENISNNNYTNKNKIKNNHDDYINSKSNYNKNYLNTYMTQKNNFNTRGTFYNKNKIKNEPNLNEALLERMNIKNKYNNMNKYYTSNIRDDNVYQEFIINYKSGTNPDDENKQSNTIDRKKPNSNIMQPKSKIYNRVSLNNGIYKVDKKSFNNNNLFNNENKVDKIKYFNSTYQPNPPYQRRKIIDFQEKEPIENGMPDKIKKELYFKNYKNNSTNYNFFDKKINKRNAYNYNFNTYNKNSNNYDRNYDNNNINENNYKYNFNISQKDFMNKKKNLLSNKINIEKKVNDFLEHFSEYCIQYYHRIIKQLFSYLKKARENAITRKYMIISHKNRPIDKNNTFNINIKNNRSNYRNYFTKVISTTNTQNKSDITDGRNNYHKSTDLLIDRIRYNNETKSPDKKNNYEMFRDINELTKKYEMINNRKNRQSYNGNFKKGNNLSFNASSVEKSKEKEKWEKNLEKERELKKIKAKKKDNNNINKQKPKEKKNLILIQNNNESPDKSNNNNSIRNKYKYKKLNLNNKTKNNNSKNKIEMRIVKKIQTKDKKIQINIRYLNYYKPIKLKEKKNNDSKYYKSLKKSNTFDITLFAIKNRNKNTKKENNTKDKKLASIKEEKENKVEVSLSD